MKGLFNLESKFGNLLNQFGQLILLSLYWLLFSLPVFTWGAASCALYSSCRKLIHDAEGKLFQNFYAAFKQNFKQGCIVGMITTLFLIIVIYCALLMVRLRLFVGTIGMITGIIYLVTVGAVLLYVHYVLSYIARFRDPLKTVLRNCVYLSLVHFDTTVRLAIQLVIVGVACYYLELIRYLPILIMLLPSGYSVITVDPLEKVFKQYMPKGNDGADKIMDTDEAGADQ